MNTFSTCLVFSLKRLTLCSEPEVFIFLGVFCSFLRFLRIFLNIIKLGLKYL